MAFKIDWYMSSQSVLSPSFCLSVGNAKISSSTGSFVLRIFIQISYYINLMLLDYINDDPIKIMHGLRLTGCFIDAKQY